MSKKYLAEKADKKKSALRGLWVLVIVGIVFVVIIVRIALGGMDSPFRTGLPSSGEAYDIAKDFVKNSTRLDSPSFPDDGYGFGKKTDSIFVISSYVESEGGGEKRKTNFTVIMKYNGGPKGNLNNWTLLDISENQ